MTKELEALADAQAGLFLRSQALAAGYDRRDIDRKLRAGSWELVGRGIYATADTVIALRAAPRGDYLIRCAVRLLRIARDSAISHESAALLLGIPLLDLPIGAPQLTVPHPSSTTRGRLPGRHLAALPLEHVTDVAGVRLTVAARTAVDLARSLPLDAALVSADAVLRMGLPRTALLDVLQTCRHWPGIQRARVVAVLATPWSESPLESLAMHWFRCQQLPIPQQQLTVRRQDGTWLARVDFVWPDRRTVCEVDGRQKYVAFDGNRLVEEKGSVQWREKLREDAMRDTGLEVARGYWSDRGDDGAALAGRIRQAFARAAAAGLPGTYRITDERVHAQIGPFAPVRSPVSAG
jgi:very-short-patch-repair endonuclease